MIARKMHFRGALQWTTGRGVKTVIAAGWAACCSGIKADRIRTRGQNTYDKSKVDCKGCLAAMRKAGVL